MGSSPNMLQFLRICCVATIAILLFSAILWTGFYAPSFIQNLFPTLNFHGYIQSYAETSNGTIITIKTYSNDPNIPSETVQFLFSNNAYPETQGVGDWVLDNEITNVLAHISSSPFKYAPGWIEDYVYPLDTLYVPAFEKDRLIDK